MTEADGPSRGPDQRKPPSGSRPPRSHLHLHLHGDGPLHRLAPEAKIVGLVAFVLVVALTPRHLIGVLLVDGAVVASVVAVAGLPVRVVVGRLAVILPFVAFAALLPVIGGGEQATVLGVPLSVDGLWAAWNVLAKAGIGASASIVLAATTPVPDVLAGLSRLRLPAVLVAILAFMFRYLDLVVDQFARTRRAMAARAHDPRWLWQARPLAAASGTLFVRTYERGERVHGAMLARGWTGTMPDLGGPAPSLRQWSLALGPAVVAAIALVTALVTGADAGAGSAAGGR